MKKTTRKIFALMLTVLMLMSVMSIQSFAALDSLKAPVVEAVEFADENPVSLKEVKAYFDEEEEWFKEAEEEGWELDYTIEDVTYDISYSGIYYEANVIFADGNEIAVDLDEWSAEINDVYKMYVDAYVTYADYKKAVEDKADTVNVTVEVDVWGTLIGSTTEEPAKFNVEKDLVSALVLSFVPLSGVPSEVYDYSDYFEIDGAKFLVTYTDLSTETITVASYTDEYDYICYETEDGESIDIDYDYDEEILTVYYLDAEYEKAVALTDEPFEGIEITECDFDSKTATLNSISYTVTWNDGRTERYTKVFDEALELDEYYVIEYIEDYYVFLIIEPYTYTDDGFAGDNYSICLEIGYDSDEYHVENPYGGVLNFYYRILSWIETIRMFILNLILGF